MHSSAAGGRLRSRGDAPRRERMPRAMTERTGRRVVSMPAALVRVEEKLTALAGEAWLEGPLGTQAMATFHPAYILHLEPHDAEGSRQAREALKLDLTTVMARLGADAPASPN